MILVYLSYAGFDWRLQYGSAGETVQNIHYEYAIHVIPSEAGLFEDISLTSITIQFTGTTINCRHYGAIWGVVNVKLRYNRNRSRNNRNRSPNNRNKHWNTRTVWMTMIRRMRRPVENFKLYYRWYKYRNRYT